MAKTTKGIKFRRPYSLKHHTTPSGSGEWDEYDYDFNGKNQKVLVKTGTKNMYKEIQSYHESTKIENILARVAIGDMSDFRPDGIYQDVTKIPTNLIDAKKEMLKVDKIWNNLPYDIQKKYDFDKNVFMDKMGTEAWLIDTGLYVPKVVEPTPVAAAPDTTVETPTTE